MQYQRFLLVFIAIIFLTPFILSSCAKKISAEVLNEYRFTTLAGDKASLPLKNKYLVLNFWATWCLPCVEELPELSQLNESLNNDEIEFIGVSIDDGEKTKKFFKANELTSFKIVYSEQDAMTLSEKLGNDKSVVPYTVVIDQNGNVTKQIFGRVNIQELSYYLSSLKH